MLRTLVAMSTAVASLAKMRQASDPSHGPSESTSAGVTSYDRACSSWSLNQVEGTLFAWRTMNWGIGEAFCPGASVSACRAGLDDQPIEGRHRLHKGKCVRQMTSSKLPWCPRRLCND